VEEDAGGAAGERAGGGCGHGGRRGEGDEAVGICRFRRRECRTQARKTRP
jgi:hypothetical protein